MPTIIWQTDNHGMSTPPPDHAPLALHKVLAIDTSTERMSVALGAGGAVAPVATYEGAGGAQASSQLIPVILDLLAQAGWTLAELDALAFGCGPGSFTGLRTACAVVQGLAVAARPGGIPVLPVNTLLAVAEEARWQCLQTGHAAPSLVVALLDARMDEMYVAPCLWQTDAHGSGHWHTIGHPWLSAPEALSVPGADVPSPEAASPTPWLAGNAMALYGERLPPHWQACPQIVAWPTATAMLRLAPSLWAQGLAVDAAGAQPLYVRDKVAKTTEERERIKAQKAADTHNGSVA
jgi:tRNA threonylcarbamoyladenosine biosynthesis protein TsaB